MVMEIRDRSICDRRAEKIVELCEQRSKEKTTKRSNSTPLVCAFQLSNFRSSGSELRQTQHDVRQQRRDEEQRKDGRSVLIIIQPFCAPRPQPQSSVNEDNGGVRDGYQSRKGEHRGGDQTMHVTWLNEVEEGSGDCSDVDREVKPFLRNGYTAILRIQRWEGNIPRTFVRMQSTPSALS